MWISSGGGSEIPGHPLYDWYVLEEKSKEDINAVQSTYQALTN